MYFTSLVTPFSSGISNHVERSGKPCISETSKYEGVGRSGRESNSGVWSCNVRRCDPATVPFLPGSRSFRKVLVMILGYFLSLLDLQEKRNDTGGLALFPLSPWFTPFRSLPDWWPLTTDLPVPFPSPFTPSLSLLIYHKRSSPSGLIFSFLQRSSTGFRGPPILTGVDSWWRDLDPGTQCISNIRSFLYKRLYK